MKNRTAVQSRPAFLKLLLTGALAGLSAGVAMLTLMAALRLFVGVATPTEMIFDRLFPFLTVKFFIGSLVRAGGYSQLKLQGVYGALAGQLGTAAFGGVVYALFLGRLARPRSADAPSRLLDPRGWRLIVPGVLVVWAVIVALLWPQLLTNYRGHPPASATVITILALLASFGLCGVSIMFFYGLLTVPPSGLGITGEPSTAGLTRRRFLAGGLSALVAVTLGGLLRRLYEIGSFSYDGTQYGGPQVQKITPTDKFYQVTKNLVDPNVARDIWRFDIVGNVETPKVWTFAELTALPAVEQETTMQCISYGVGSGLISNAVWKGVPLPALLAQARPKNDCGGVLFHAADGFFETIPLAKLGEATTLLAYEMNGQPLPSRHGFPMRLIVPGIYGERNPKWVTRLEFIQKDDPRLKINRHGIEGVGFYTEQGWGPNVYVPTTSRIDAPQVEGGAFAEPFRVGQKVELRGMAFGGDKGISRVEVSTDGGQTYAAAEIHEPGTLISWSLWRYEWTPTTPAEEVRVFVRAVNARGERQIEEFRDQVPHGALGLHWVRGRVQAGDGTNEPAKVAVAERPSVTPRTALCRRGIWNA
jgi:DMSO/TMAO reductase YedYZ molybdopterin-dependent catalytic subunit